MLSGTRVLVTGAGGFIGSHLVERLEAEGATVTALVRYRSDGRAGWLETSPARARIQIRTGDVCDQESVLRAMDGCDIVCHLAALIGIPYSYEAPRSYVRTNVEGTLNILEAARRVGVRRVVHTSTSEVYGTPDEVPISERHPLKGQSPYSASKIGADMMAESYHRSFETPVVILRPFNTYGPRQSARAVLPTILSQLLSGAPVLRLGALTPRRDLTYVDDTVDGFVRAATADGAVGRTIQLGTGRDVSVEELARMAMAAVGRVVPIECENERVRPRDSEVQRLLSAPDLAASVLGWRPRVDLEAGLAKTADWVRANLHTYRSGEYSV